MVLPAILINGFPGKRELSYLAGIIPTIIIFIYLIQKRLQSKPFLYYFLFLRPICLPMTIGTNNLFLVIGEDTNHGQT
jgi:uncharacterized membrane protein YjdF